MNRVLGICNLHDGPNLGRLSANTTLGCVTFLGRFGLMDFTLSNFTNSGINKICVLVEDHVQSVRNHIGDGQVWVSNTKTGFQRILFNEKGVSSPKFNTDIANITTNRDVIEEASFEYVIIAPAFFIMNVDFRDALKAHIYSQKKISVLYKKIDNADKEFLNCDTISFKKDKSISSVGFNNGQTEKANICLETFIINRDEFFKIVDDQKQVSHIYNLRRMIYHGISTGQLDVNAIEFKDIVIPFLSYDHYVRNSMAVLNKEVAEKLFKKDWLIYTKIHSTPPTVFGPDAEVRNCYIANGCKIYGKVENSILSRDVVVEKGAVVKDCILFTHTEVGKDVKAQYLMCDKTVKIETEKNPTGEKDSYLYIGRGAKI